MTEPQFKQFWIAKIFRAETAIPPKIVYSSDSTNQLVEIGARRHCLHGCLRRAARVESRPRGRPSPRGAGLSAARRAEVMSIRRRLTLAFGTILALFALTQGFQLWSAQLRARSMGTVDRALKRQLIMSSLRNRVENLQKQVSLLGQVDGAEDMPEARQFFSDEIDHAAADIGRLLSLADPQNVPAVKALQSTYGLLAEAWRQFYSYLVAEPGWAIAFQLRAEPLSRRVLEEQLPALVREQDELARAAEARFTAVTLLTQRVSTGIFVLSMLLASAIAYSIARRLTADWVN